MEEQKKYFFYLSKDMVLSGDWARMNNPLRPIVVIINQHSDRFGNCYPSTERIAKLSGMSVNTVRKHLPSLKDLDGYSYEPRNKSAVKWHYKYTAPILKNGAGENILINNSMIVSGMWASITIPAQSVYVAMRAKAVSDIRRLDYFTDKYDYESQAEAYRWRCSDVIWKLNKKEIQRLSGLSRQSCYTAFEMLEEKGFIKNVYDENGDLEYIRVMIRGEWDGEYDDYMDIEFEKEIEFDYKW